MTSNEWRNYKFSELVYILGGGTPKTTVSEYWNGTIPWLSVKDFNSGEKFVYTTEKTITQLGLEKSSTQLLKKNDIILSARGTVGEIAVIPFLMAFNQSCYGIRAKEEIINSDFLYYLLKNSINLLKHNTHGSVFDTITRETFDSIEIKLPPLETQQKIAKVLSAIDDKIELNNSINNNLEQQAQAIFLELFKNKIDNVEFNNNKQLKELVQNVDNRGKTPPCTTVKTLYPIIDVRALSGNTRIIDYNKCTKYVEKDTYDNWFRNGHPQKYDILLSTVGSLAEMKLFMGQIGCIAQNVVGYRCNISPLYLYQYLNFIKKDLLAYDIGSVQPSIKVTHIAKHPIYIPSKNELEKFHSISEAITNKIYNNCKENEYLTQLRDTLLPKLMSGEINVSKVEIDDILENQSTDKLLFSEEKYVNE